MSWEKVKLSEFLKARDLRFKYDAAEIKGLKRIEKINFSGSIVLSYKPSRTDMILIKNGDLVISGINVAKGAIAVYQGDDDITATIHYSSYEFDNDRIDIDFLKMFLKSPEFLNAIKEQVPGGIKTEIKPKHLLPLEVEIPGIEEQKQIVRNYLSFQIMNDNLKKEIELQNNLVTQLRQAFLREAMQGKLVPQEPTNEPASELLNRIKTEKEKLIAEGKIKKQKPLPEIKPEDLPYEIPSCWVWCRLDEISEKINDGTHNSPPNFEKGEFIYITAKNIKESGVDLSDITYITKEYHDKIYERCNPEFGDILFIKDGATTGVGTINNLKVEFSLLSSVALLKTPWILNIYLLYAMRSPIFYNSIRNDMSGVAITRVTVTKIKNAIVPIPPLAEQQRIVTKLNELMEFCDQLEQNINVTKEQTNLLLQAVLREGLEGKE